MSIAQHKSEYQQLEASLVEGFLKSPSAVEGFVLARSNGVDQLLRSLWVEFEMSNALSLVAVGGYGRAELHLYSDVDLLILIPQHSHQQHQASVAKFLTALWDIGLEVGHATRDLDDCIEAIEDLSVVTSLLESRRIIGDESLFYKMQSVISNSQWSSQSFLVEKQKEQQKRHINFENTAYSLEPNVKESPGGLRDIQTVAWVAKFYFGVESLFQLVEQSYLSKQEFEILKTSQLFLWKVRYALHIVAKRREDRLVFQHQKELAKTLGYIDGETLAVEVFMKDYYRTVTKVSRLSDILLQLLGDRVLNTQNINTRFVISYGYIKATSAKVFVQNPQAFIEIFLLIAKHDYVRGINAATLRDIQTNIDLIDDDFHKNLAVNRLFIELLQQKRGVNKALKLMNRYGVLERYIPAFGKITGLMQYDLFHEFTVDQHTLFVIRNLRRFFVSEFDQEFDLCSEIAQNISNPEVLFLGALFHDIAKGRGGDHAILGAEDARQFCKHHQLKAADVQLVADLVYHHLLMSKVSQKQDIDDIEVIQRFAAQVKTIEFLELLYLLTVADICATKADLWNDWKDSLLKNLFHKTKQYLQNGHESSTDSEDASQQSKDLAIRSALEHGYEMSVIKQVFGALPKEYFLRYEIEEILWHLYLLDKHQDQAVIVGSKLSPYHVINLFVVCQDTQGLFFKLVSTVERLGLEIVDAKILTTKDNRAYNTIGILQDESLRQIDINTEISKALSESELNFNKASDKYLHRFFDYQIKVEFSFNQKWNLTQLEINVLDKQGILSSIAYVFYELGIILVNARIATIGERVEDVFFISNQQGQALNREEQMQLKNLLEERL